MNYCLLQIILNYPLIFFYLFKNHITDFQRLNAVVNRDRRFCIVGYRIMKTLQFCQYRVYRSHFRLFDTNLFASSVGEVYSHRQWVHLAFHVIDSHYLGFLLQEVDGDICVFLEETMLDISPTLSIKESTSSAGIRMVMLALR